MPVPLILTTNNAALRADSDSYFFHSAAKADATKTDE
jgi:hypothetical protein